MYLRNQGICITLRENYNIKQQKEQLQYRIKTEKDTVASAIVIKLRHLGPACTLSLAPDPAENESPNVVFLTEGTFPIPYYLRLFQEVHLTGFVRRGLTPSIVLEIPH
ncbi:MAG: hypothetical protein IKL04_01810, partial [Lachnospiraceae bacterium]|nr:hypothetical protein [Lachnospiraceae bacterium]